MPGFASLRLPFLRWIFFASPLVVGYLFALVWGFGCGVLSWFVRYTPSPRGAGLVFAVVCPSLQYALPLEVCLVCLKLLASSFPLVCLAFVRLYTKVR